MPAVDSRALRNSTGAVRLCAESFINFLILGALRGALALFPRWWAHLT
jgi:hypothetical protein